MRTISLIMMILLFSCFQVFAETNTENEQRNLNTLRTWGEEVWGKGKLELAQDLVATKYIRHDANGTRTVTPESYSKEIEALLAEGIRFEVDAISADGDLVWTRWTLHSMGEKDRTLIMKGLQVYRFENGKIAETWWLSAPGSW